MLFICHFYEKSLPSMHSGPGFEYSSGRFPDILDNNVVLGIPKALLHSTGVYFPSLIDCKAEFSFLGE